MHLQSTTLDTMTKVVMGAVVDLRARCRDCGAEVDPERLRGRHVTKELETDRGHPAWHVVAAGFCRRCSGGRFEVAMDLGLE